MNINNCQKEKKSLDAFLTNRLLIRKKDRNPNVRKIDENWFIPTVWKDGMFKTYEAKIFNTQDELVEFLSNLYFHSRTDYINNINPPDNIKPFSNKDAQYVSTEAAKDEIENIIQLIKEAAKEKKTEVFINNISQAALFYFREHGFEYVKIGTNDKTYFSTVKISWFN